MHQRLHSARQQLIGIVLLMPLLFVLFKWALPSLPSNPMLKEAFWSKKVDADSSYDIVYIGDSRVYRGIDPELVFKQTQLKGLNFGFSSAGLSAEIIQIGQQHLSAKGARCLLIAVSPNALLFSTHNNGHYHQLMQQPTVDRYLQATLYPSLQTLHAYAISDFVKWRAGEAYYETFHLDNGFVYSNHLPYDSSAALYQYQTQLSKNAIDTTQAYNLIKTLKNLQAQGFTIVLTRMPSSWAMRQLEDRLSKGFIGRWLAQAQSQGLTYLHLLIGPYHSYDGSHLDGASASNLSKVIGDSLQRICKPRY